MTHLTIDNKKYVLISEESYQELKKLAALKREPEKTFIERGHGFVRSVRHIILRDQVWQWLAQACLLEWGSSAKLNDAQLT